ncbi:hypothetical protein NW768_010892 [Fusarium equiseti]|uniref:Heterokaryon incompatibility domain-containing protein n=1 Tax=Fusarium equiseti TaxID=61235 RepID=A0ABQ8QZ95_FUSEQ|nr:hypothetical protein NW768_010892 [Fusarium equiseti]
MRTYKVTTPYAPLPPNDSSATRLVKVLPAGFDDPIRCELETISLENEPPYIALSYVWGDPTDTLPMLLNGLKYSVTRNLDSFLRHLQSLLKETFLVLQCLSVHDWPSGLQIVEALNSLSLDQQNSQDLSGTAQAAILAYLESIEDHAGIDKIGTERSRPVQITQWNDSSLPRFWIDALSINQNDPVERNTQVKRMSHIYSQTALLLVWGLNSQQPEISEKESESILRDVEFLYTTLVYRDSQSSPTTNDSEVTNAVRSLLTTKENVIKSGIVEATSSLFQLEWFYRAWVFQEVALSASKPSELWMGFKHIGLAKLIVAGTAIMDVSAELEPDNSFIGIMCEVKASRTLLALRMDKNLIELGQDSLHSVQPTSYFSVCRRLIYILSAGHLGFNVTDPRDAIYSLYGLLSTNRLPATLEPDYTKPVSVVYHSAAAFLLSHLGIEILGFFLSSLDGIHGCPSWVPDFSCLQRYDTLCQQYPSVDMAYDYRVIDELLSIEEVPPHGYTVAKEFDGHPSLLRISCPVYWLQAIETVVCIEGDWVYPQLKEGESANEFLLRTKPLKKAVATGVLNAILNYTQFMDFSIWVEFLERTVGYTLSPYWSELIGIEEDEVADGYEDLLDAGSHRTVT